MNGKETKADSASNLKYARAGGAFNWRPDTEEKAVKSASEAQKNRDAPGLCLILGYDRDKTVSALRRAGYSVENVFDETTFLVDAGAVDWFAYDNQ
jgi:hypothetical protein